MKKIAAIFALAFVTIFSSAHAVNYYWDVSAGANNGVGGSGTWSTTAARWSTTTNGDATLTSGTWTSTGQMGQFDTAVFTGTSGSVTHSGVVANTVLVNTSGYTLLNSSAANNNYITTTNGIQLGANVNLNISGGLGTATGNGASGYTGGIKQQTGTTGGTLTITGNTGVSTTPNATVRITFRTNSLSATTNIIDVPVVVATTGDNPAMIHCADNGATTTLNYGITVNNGSKLTLSPGGSSSRTIIVRSNIVTSADSVLAIGETGNLGLVILRGTNILTGNLNVIGQLGYQNTTNALGQAKVVLTAGSTFGQSGTMTGSETNSNPIRIEGDVKFGGYGFACYFAGNIDLASGTRTINMGNSTTLSGAMTNGSLVFTNSSTAQTLTFNGPLTLTNLTLVTQGINNLNGNNQITNLIISNGFTAIGSGNNTIDSFTVNRGSLGAGNLGNGAKNLTLSGVGATATFSNTANSGSLAVGPLTLGGSNNIVMATSGSTSIASSGAITLSGTGNVITLNGSVLASGVTYPLITGTSVNTNGLTGPVTLTGAGVNNAVNLTLNGAPVISGANTYTFRSTATALELQVDQNLVNNYSWSGGSTGNWNTDPANTVWTLGGSAVGFTSGSNANAEINTTNGSIGLTVDAGGISAGYVTVTGGSGATLDGGNLSALGLSTTNTALTVNCAVTATNFSVTNSSVSGSGSISTVGGTTVQCDTDQSLSVAITGTGGVTKSGTGTLTVSGGSTYTGNLVVSSGALATSGSSAIPDNATLVLSNAATLNLGGNETVGGLFAAFGSFINLQQYTLTAGGNNSSYTNGATITGTGGIVKNGTGIMYMNTNGNTFSGGFTLNAGEVQFTSSGTASGGSITSTMFGTGPLTLNGGIFGSSSSNSGRSVHNSVVLNGSVQFGSTAWGTSTTNLNAGTPNLTFTTNGGGTTTLQSDSTISTIGSVQWDQKLSGDFRLTKTGVGASSLSNNYLTLRASNDISGVTVVSGSLGYKNRYALGKGTLNLKNGVVLGQEGTINNFPLTGNDQVDRSIPNPILVDGDVTFGLGGTGCYFAGDIDLNGGSRILTLANSTSLYGQITNGQILTIDNGTGSSKTLSLFASNTYTGGTVVRTNAALAVGHDQALGNGDLTFTNTSGSGVAILRAATLSTNATQVRTLANNIKLASGMTVTLDAVSSAQDSAGTNITVAVDMILSGNISGAGGLTKSNNNTVTLSGQNTYSGATAVVNGKLEVVTNNIFATITTNTVAVTFSNTPANGTYAILPGALTGTYTLTNTTASSTQKVTLSTASPASVTVASKSSQTISGLTSTDTKTYGDSAYTLSVTKGASSSPLTFESSNTGVATVSSAGLVTIVGAGSTTIRVNQAGDDNYLAATEATQVLTVAKAATSITAAPTASAITYGQTLADANLTGGTGSVGGAFAFTTPSTAPSAGTANQNVTFTPTDAANYNTSTTTVSVTVNKATPSITAAPTASAITSGQALSSSTLSGGTGSVAGSFAWTSPSEIPSSTGSFSVTFTPTDSANYNNATINVSVTVNSAGPTFDGAYSGKNLTDVAPNGLTYLMNYAFGGSDTTEPKLPVQDTADSTKLALVAYVRTGDTSLSVGGQAAASLDFSSPSSATYEVITPSDAPAGMEKRRYSVGVSGDRQFLRLIVTKQ